MKSPEIPITDDHIHFNPRAGRGVEAAKDFWRAGGTHLFMVSLPAYSLGVLPRTGDDYREAFDETLRVAELVRGVGITVFPVVSAAEKLAALNPEIAVEAVRTVIDAATVADLAAGADVIVDAMDNFETRYLLNETALARKIPLVHGGISGFFGQATTVIPGRTPCLRCLFPTPRRTRPSRPSGPPPA